MKFNYHNAPPKRKMLKLNYDYEVGDPGEDDDDNEIDIKDIEFRMSHDKRQVQVCTFKCCILIELRSNGSDQL